MVNGGEEVAMVNGEVDGGEVAMVNGDAKKRWSFPPELEDFDLMSSDVDPAELEQMFADDRWAPFIPQPLFIHEACTYMWKTPHKVKLHAALKVCISIHMQACWKYFSFFQCLFSEWQRSIWNWDQTVPDWESASSGAAVPQVGISLSLSRGSYPTVQRREMDDSNQETNSSQLTIHC